MSKCLSILSGRDNGWREKKSEQEEGKIIMESVMTNISGELKQRSREQEDNLDVFFSED